LEPFSTMSTEEDVHLPDGDLIMNDFPTSEITITDTKLRDTTKGNDSDASIDASELNEDLTRLVKRISDLEKNYMSLFDQQSTITSISKRLALLEETVYDIQAQTSNNNHFQSVKTTVTGNNYLPLKTEKPDFFGGSEHDIEVEEIEDSYDENYDAYENLKKRLKMYDDGNRSKAYNPTMQNNTMGGERFGNPGMFGSKPMPQSQFGNPSSYFNNPIGGNTPNLGNMGNRYNPNNVQYQSSQTSNTTFNVTNYNIHTGTGQNNANMFKFGQDNSFAANRAFYKSPHAPPEGVTRTNVHERGSNIKIDITNLKKTNDPYAAKPCTLCDKVYDGRNADFNRQWHMISHNKIADKLLQDLKQNKPPYYCPIQDCTFKVFQNKKSWSIHYGYIHDMVEKVEEELVRDAKEKGIELTDD